jgi:hypothetical protein
LTQPLGCSTYTNQRRRDTGDGFKLGQRFPAAMPAGFLPMSSILLRWLNHRVPVNVFLARKAIQAFSLFSYEDRLKICAIDRPHYGHCLFEAAKLAARLKYPKISAIEFGCGGAPVGCIFNDLDYY